MELKTKMALRACLHEWARGVRACVCVRPFGWLGQNRHKQTRSHTQPAFSVLCLICLGKIIICWQARQHCRLLLLRWCVCCVVLCVFVTPNALYELETSITEQWKQCIVKLFFFSIAKHNYNILGYEKFTLIFLILIFVCYSTLILLWSYMIH